MGLFVLIGILLLAVAGLGAVILFRTPPEDADELIFSATEDADPYVGSSIADVVLQSDDTAPRSAEDSRVLEHRIEEHGVDVAIRQASGGQIDLRLSKVRADRIAELLDEALLRGRFELCLVAAPGPDDQPATDRYPVRTANAESFLLAQYADRDAFREFVEGAPAPPSRSWRVGPVDFGPQSQFRSYLLHDPPVFEGWHFENAHPQAHPEGHWILAADLVPDAAARFADFTRANVGHHMAMVADGAVIAAPRLHEPITDGRMQVAFGADHRDALERASKLAETIRRSALRNNWRVETVQHQPTETR